MPTRRFELVRNEDKSGVSGTGTVADGIMFDDGQSIIKWRGGDRGVRSLAIYNSMAEVKDIHGHEGATEIKWIDEQEEDGKSN
jgi:hypothetical protein